MQKQDISFKIKLKNLEFGSNEESEKGKNYIVLKGYKYVHQLTVCM